MRKHSLHTLTNGEIMGMDHLVKEARSFDVSVEFGKPRILVVGCGGAGNNSVDRLMRIGVHGAKTVAITQKTRYPWQGAVTMTVEPKDEFRFALKVRIPGWAQNTPVPSDLYKYMNKSSETASLKLNGKPVALAIKNG
ncbi:MAG: glycoside hydrolase family 127 protein, partial [Candidatus Thermoplasmatota archaeon]|nr:glycoside hydrolase family 127 protein [Candidatus Thermoplasmatota archaeon]